MHARQLTQHPPDRVVGRGTAEVAARAPHHPVVRDLVAQLSDERRLAEPGIGHDVDESTGARGRAGERRPNGGQLALAPGEGGDDLGRLLIHGVPHRLDRDRDDRQHVPLHQERLHLAHIDLHVRASDHLERGEHLAPRGLPHDPGRDVDRVALDRVRPPVVGAEVAGEHRPWLTPARSGSRKARSTMSRAVPSTRSSTSRPLPGAPLTSMSLPPLRPMSLSRNVVACRAQASWTLRTSSSRASATASGPAEASSSSVPENWMNATPTARCSEVPAAARRCSRSGGVSRLATSTSPSGSMLEVGGAGQARGG